MPNYASITVIGHLGRDPETKEFGDNSVTNFSIAVTQKRKGKEDLTTWVDCAAWNKTGQLCQQYLKKGSAAMIVGTPALETYTGKDGTPKSKLTVQVKEVQFLGGKDAAKDEEPAEVELKAGDGVERLKKMLEDAKAKAPVDDGIPF